MNFRVKRLLSNRSPAFVWLVILIGCASVSAAEITRILSVTDDPSRLRGVRLSGGGKYLVALTVDEVGKPSSVEVFDLAGRRRTATVPDPRTFIEVSDRGNRVISGDRVDTNVFGIGAEGSLTPLKSLTNVRVIDCDASGNVLACIQVDGGLARATVHRLDTGVSGARSACRRGVYPGCAEYGEPGLCNSTRFGVANHAPRRSLSVPPGGLKLSLGCRDHSSA